MKKGLKPQVSREEVLKHNKADDCWVIIEDRVYRLDKWILTHPGGSAPILSVAGQDATEAFTGFHPAVCIDWAEEFGQTHASWCSLRIAHLFIVMIVIYP